MSTAALQHEIKAGRALYNEMLATFDFSQITWTITRYTPSMSGERADELMKAFLQWAAIIPLNTPDHYATMFLTPVEEAFHSFVLNTRLYNTFCLRYLGQFFHHDPVVDDTGPEVEKQARYTVELLEETYGAELHPELQEWRRQLDAGTYRVACVGSGTCQ